jgi:hypothetical protein
MKFESLRSEPEQGLFRLPTHRLATSFSILKATHSLGKADLNIFSVW